MPAENLHLTLAFLGEVEDEHTGALRAELTALDGTPAPELVLIGAGAFPSTRRPRVLWVGARESGGTRLATLQRSVLEVCARAGVPVPDAERPFRPHVTVARARGAIGSTPTAFLELDFERPWVPTAVELFESRPGGRGTGPRYVPAASVPLAGGTV